MRYVTPASTRELIPADHNGITVSPFPSTALAGRFRCRIRAGLTGHYCLTGIHCSERRGQGVDPASQRMRVRDQTAGRGDKEGVDTLSGTGLVGQVPDSQVDLIEIG